MTATPQILSAMPTPRVDAAERFMRSPNRPPFGFVPSEVARQLEMELAMALEVAYGRASLQELEEVIQTGAPMPGVPASRGRKSVPKVRAKRMSTSLDRSFSTRETKPTTWPSSSKAKWRFSTRPTTRP